MTATFEDALALATEKFRGITDSDGQPYILHCLRVTLAQSDDLARQVAVLHDVVEDTDVTLERIDHPRICSRSHRERRCLNASPYGDLSRLHPARGTDRYALGA